MARNSLTHIRQTLSDVLQRVFDILVSTPIDILLYGDHPSLAIDLEICLSFNDLRCGLFVWHLVITSSQLWLVDWLYVRVHYFSFLGKQVLLPSNWTSGVFPITFLKVDWCAEFCRSCVLTRQELTESEVSTNNTTFSYCLCRLLWIDLRSAPIYARFCVLCTLLLTL